ncbi:response regulator transcription factor [uncultured Draconibacterium sp.]|uniref:response regulator transcription factor n=1 Tax=uncultured Draconibacterium sp. TaxID=1573823 RepID=UPI003217D07A
MNSILIADDHPLIVKSIFSLIREVFPKVTIYTASNWKEVQLTFIEKNDVFILDLEMPCGDAADTIEHINCKFPKAKVLILTSHTQSWVFQGLSELKIDAFVSKLSEPSEIIEALVQLNKNQLFMCTEFKRVYSYIKKGITGFEQLTKREKEVLTLILDAKSTKEIALDLSVSENTIETHRKNLFLKYEVKNVVGLVNKAMGYGNLKRVF